ncbi:uncharacterized protein BO97DRAFT_409607 [Aspergillus homomorphus CBS 101889]|uniref:Uncharacterized protein n=1 Tax=Aspergillus homomorphus (strain CBS 101889) TaxID=1450537 RepID=A0A395HF39_ASPHC|nr:hypothetical protein BO97DRAFT_409607 [Aspergillus homomorphus CBS 101889]RAL06502.1 hypothetical protein BO97DRAFT_409607 [Aspergillus homomorphus CBS 101889]
MELFEISGSPSEPIGYPMEQNTSPARTRPCAASPAPKRRRTCYADDFASQASYFDGRYRPPSPPYQDATLHPEHALISPLDSAALLVALPALMQNREARDLSLQILAARLSQPASN